MVNKKGFTLIELLAVIVILGIILIIAIPSISAAILKSRKNAYVDTANQLVDAVRIAALSNPTILPTNNINNHHLTFVKLSVIKLEKRSKEKSPFANTSSSNGVIRIDFSDEYNYEICLVDEKGNGIDSLTEIKSIDTSHVKVGGEDCSNIEQTIIDNPSLCSNNRCLIISEPSELYGE